MESRSLRSARRVSTLTFEAAFCTNGASESERRSVLRPRRMMCEMPPADANADATWLPIPGPAPKRSRVRVMMNEQ